MKTLLTILLLSLFQIACVADNVPVTSGSGSVTVQLPEDQYPIETIGIYGYDEAGNPIFTPPSGSIDEQILIENTDGDDLIAECIDWEIYACGTRSDGTLMTCVRCKHYQICTGGRCMWPPF